MSKNTGFINTIQNYRFGNYRKKTKKAAKIGRLLPGECKRMVTVKNFLLRFVTALLDPHVHTLAAGCLLEAAQGELCAF